MNPVAKSFEISSPMDLRFSLSKRCKTLLNRLGARPDLQGMLGDFPRDAWHV
jgi:hypothetical protein